MNVIFVLIVLIAFLFAGWQQIFFVPDEGGPVAMEILSKAMIESAGGDVELTIGLVVVMALFLGTPDAVEIAKHYREEFSAKVKSSRPQISNNAGPC